VTTFQFFMLAAIVYVAPKLSGKSAYISGTFCLAGAIAASVFKF